MKPHLPTAKFAIGQPVCVVLNERNHTAHQGIIRNITWHHKDQKYNYYLRENDKNISKRYYDDDLQSAELGAAAEKVVPPLNLSGGFHRKTFMHLIAEHTVNIACSTESAFHYATNLEHFGEWFPGVVAIESANGLAHAELGKQYLETVIIPLLGTKKVKLLVKVADPNRLFVTEGNLSPLLPRMEIQFQALNAESCQVTWRMFSRNKHLLARYTLIPLARKIMIKRAATGIAHLKQRLEAQ